MAPVATEGLTIESAGELSDQELDEIGKQGDDADKAIAKAELDRRAREFAESRAEHPPEAEEILLDGTTELTLFDVGGKQPTRATIKFTGGKVKLVHGQAFKKGDRIRFSGEAIVNVLAQKDEHDPKTGQVVDCEQRHEARIVDLRLDSAD